MQNLRTGIFFAQSEIIRNANDQQPCRPSPGCSPASSGRGHAEMGRRDRDWRPRGLPLFRPPRLSLGGAINDVLAGFSYSRGNRVFAPLVVFVPPWRTALVNDFDIHLPSSLTPAAMDNGDLFDQFRLPASAGFTLLRRRSSICAAFAFQLRVFAAGDRCSSRPVSIALSGNIHLALLD